MYNSNNYILQGKNGVLAAGGGGELQDRRVQGVAPRQGVPHRVRAHELQREDERGALPALHRQDAPDQGSSSVSR